MVFLESISSQWFKTVFSIKKKNFFNAFSTLILQILLIENITEITPSDILAVS